jgi:hypothetical protein
MKPEQFSSRMLRLLEALKAVDRLRTYRTASDLYEHMPWDLVEAAIAEGEKEMTNGSGTTVQRSDYCIKGDLRITGSGDLPAVHPRGDSDKVADAALPSAQREAEGASECSAAPPTIVEDNLADYARRYFDLFEQYRTAWLREMGGVIRPKHWEIDGFVLRMRDIYEKAQLVDRMKQLMVKKLKGKGCSAEELFDAVFQMLAENGHDKVPTQ